MGKRVPKYLSETTNEVACKRGRQFERDLVRKTIASGSIDWDPGDIQGGDIYLAELKCTDKKSYSIKYNDVLKIFEEALTMGKTPIFIIKIKDLQLTGKVTKVSPRLKREI